MAIDVSNSLYYTFSTTSQVLAAFISLSSVFVIFKMQELKKIQFIQVQSFYNYMNGIIGLQFSSFYDCPEIAVTLKCLHQAECLGGMKEEMDGILAYDFVRNSSEIQVLRRMMAVFNNVDKVRRSILNLTKYSIIIGLLTILIALTVLVFVPWIGINLSIPLYGICFLGFISSMAAMVRVIFISLKEKNFMALR